MSRPHLRPRYLKLILDLFAEKERLALMLAAIALSLTAVGAVLGGYAVLSRAIVANYLGTRPAAATLELPKGVDAEVLAIARRHPAVEDAEARDVLQARARVEGDWRPLLLFVADDFASMRLNLFTPQSGAWPPSAGSALIERTATGMLGTDVGGRIAIKTAHGDIREVPVAGLVHDPGLAPAWQERSGYAYVSRATLAQLGEAPILHELRISLRDPASDLAATEAAAADLGRQLTEAGHPVHEIRVPPPRQHPHQKQMATILFLMLAFALMALLLSAILVANSLAAILARQVREIGVMKTVGAQTGQIMQLYTALVAALGIAALAIALPAGRAGAGILATAVSRLLNFSIGDGSMPAWVYGSQILAGILVPLLVAALPIRRASHMTIWAALAEHGAGGDSLRAAVAGLPLPLRNALRRPARLAFTACLLAAGGAMLMTAHNVSESWKRMIDKVYETRHYDVEVRFHEPQTTDAAHRIAALPGVTSVETWGYSPAAWRQVAGIDIAHTYPDRGHAAFTLLAPPADTSLITFPLQAGRWLRPDDTDAVVLNHAAAAQAPQVRVGDWIDLTLDGKPTHWHVVGIVEEIGAAGVAYVTDRAFERLAGTAGKARLLRIATRTTSAEARIAVIRDIERQLAADGISVETAMPLAELRTAMADHIVILIRSLVAMAAVMGAVGGLGLSSAMGISVLERTREFGIMKTLGATPGRIARQLIAESLAIAALSWSLAVILAVPLTVLLDTLVGRLGFVAPLPIIIDAPPALAWLVISGLLAIVATALPARRAARLPVAEALVCL